MKTARAKYVLDVNSDATGGFARISTRTRGYTQTIATLTGRDGKVSLWTGRDGRTVLCDGTFFEAVGMYMAELTKDTLATGEGER